MNVDNAHLCFACLARGMAARIDRKGRCYWYCSACGTRVFSRGGAAGPFHISAVLRLLDDEVTLRWVRQQGFERAESYETSLLELLTPARSAVGGPAHVPQTVQQQLKGVGT